MNRPLTIAHLSDLHLSAEHKRHNIRKTRRVLDYVSRLNVDHLVLTGDIAAEAKPRDFEMARSILSSYGFLNPDRLTVIIGNHDIFGGVHAAEDILEFPRRCRSTDYDDKISEFRRYFPEAFEGCIFASSGKTFPFVKTLGDIVLVGVNSVARYSSLRNPLGSNGAVGKTQFKALEGILSSPLFGKKRKIVLIHHHFFKDAQVPDGAMHGIWAAIERRTLKLHGKKDLLKLFWQHNVELVLHGHLHENSKYRRKGIQFLNAGASVLGANPMELNVNIVTIADQRIEQETRTFRVDVTTETNVSSTLISTSVSSHVAA